METLREGERGKGRWREGERGSPGSEGGMEGGVRMQDSVTNPSVVRSLLELNRLLCFCIYFGGYIQLMARDTCFPLMIYNFLLIKKRLFVFKRLK